LSKTDGSDDAAPDTNPPVPHGSPEAPAGRAYPMAFPIPSQAPRRPSRVKRILLYFLVLLLLVSLLANFYLGALLVAIQGTGMAASVIRPGNEDQVVAVFQINGTIDDQSAAAFARFRRTVRDDSAIKAVVVRVDSPGGGVSASDRIHHMVQSIRRDLHKPVVVSMGGVAASGGYYISAPANEIYAEPNTITGSVGVLMILPVIKGFLQEHGVEMMTIRSRQSQRWKAAVNPFEPPDEEVYRERQRLLDEVHEKFQDVVKSGRGAKLQLRPVKVRVQDFGGEEVVLDQVEPLNGRVFLADEAMQLGLVDRIGYLHHAADAAASLANLDDPSVVQFSPRRSLREHLGFSESPLGTDIKAAADHLMAPRMMLLWQG
jgi:protease IV